MPSPQRFAAEIKLGPYAPSVDSEFGGGAKPFGDMFGSGSNVIVLAEFDWQVWRPFGSLGVGLMTGYYRNSAAPFNDDSSGGQPATIPTSDDQRSAGSTSITLFPVSLLAVYRFDVLADRFHIPVVPYAKIGINYTFWWIDRPDGEVASFEEADGSTSTAKGGTLGWQLHLGVALRLDMLEPKAAKVLDSDIGINHTYAFFEMMHLDASGFGSSTALIVGDTTWLAGLAFEF